MKSSEQHEIERASRDEDTSNSFIMSLYYGKILLARDWFLYTYISL